MSRPQRRSSSDAQPSAARPRREPNIGHLLRIPFQAVVARVATGIVAAGFNEIRPAHSSVFQHIRPEGSRLSELAESAQMTKQSMSYLVNDLEEHGYVERRPDPRDGRAVLIVLTQRGWEQVYAAAQIIDEIEREWAELLGARRSAQLRALLEDLLNYLADRAPGPTVDDVARERLRPTTSTVKRSLS
jgi:DNA-binding MarR family transcriptional regulator